MRKRWQLWLLRGGLGALALVLALAIVIAALVHTESGTRFAVERVVALEAVPVTVTRTSGSFADGLTLHDLRFENPSVDVSVTRVDLLVALSPLLRASVNVRRLATDGVHIVVKPGEAAPEPKPLTVPTLRAPVFISVDSFSARNTTVTTQTDVVIDTIDAALSWNETRLDVTRLDVHAAPGSFSARGNATLEGEVRLGLNIEWSAPPQQLAGSAKLAGSLETLNAEHSLSGAFNLESQGTIQALGRVTPAANMTHRCARDCGVAEVTLRDFALSHMGPIDDSAVTLDVNLTHAKLPATDVQLRGTSTLETLHIDSVTAQGDALDVTATGDVRWAPSPFADLNATIAALDTSIIHPDAVGIVSGKAMLRGGSADQFAVALEEVSGRINGYQLDARADIERSGERIDVQPLAVSIGDNRLEASGSVRDNRFDFDVDAMLPKLEQIVPTLGGSVKASGEVKGSAERPEIDLALEAADLAYAQWRVGAVTSDVRIVEDGAVGGTLKVQSIVGDQRAFGDTTVRLGGTRQTVTTDVDWTMPGNRFATALTITPHEQGAAIEIVNAQVTNDTLGEWKLDSAFGVGLVGSAVEIAAHRWSNDRAFARIDEVRLDGTAATVRAQLADMPLQTFDPFLPAGTRLAGSVDASVALERDDEGWQGDVEWQQSDTVIRVAQGARSRRLALQTVALSTRIAGATASCNVEVAGDHELSIRGTADLSELQSTAGPTVDGALDVTLPDLAWLSPWIDGVSELAGSVALNLKAAGTTSAPTLEGTFALDDGVVSLADAGIRLENLTLNGQGRETGALALSGQATSGGGTLRFDGEVSQAWSAERALDLSIKGNDVQAFNARDYRVWISPDLTLKVDEQGARIAGRVDVPRADVRVADVPPDVVGASDDIKVAGRETKEAFRLPVEGSVTLALGDDVHLYALGLDADLRGNLDLIVARDKKPRFNGRLYLENGKFAAYGQKLSVDRGNVFYAGAIDNPTLDFRATRTIEDVTQTIVAGVRVSGPAQNPSIDVFAEPAVSQTDALSYLLLGRAANDTSSADGEALSQAAVAIGMSRSAPLTTQLAAGLGLDELTVAGDSLDAAELVAGKQINDRLYIKYTYGVFSNLGAILLRYRLSKRLALEAGSDDAQFIDALYTIEK
ncbi:MAG: translocation/assembly module TamB domain-containing protein [Gammaproteobacteria bacterium]